MTDQTELRAAINFMKNDSGSGTKARKQDRFRQVYEPEVAHIVAGERYDDAGVGPATARSAVEAVYPELAVDEYDTISEALTTVDGGDKESLEELVIDLDGVARRSGDDQTDYLKSVLDVSAQPDLVTLALLDDENIGLGTSQMREAFFDGTRDERKRAEAFTETTTEFIRLARNGALPKSPVVRQPFDPMLAVPESRGEPENSVAQEKVDGYRVLIHIKQEEIGPKAYAFSRQRNDITNSLPELNEMAWPESGEYILDAEVIAETGSYSDTSERIGRKASNVNRDIAMNFKVFDCVVYQSDHIADSTFENRFSTVLETVNAVDDERLDILPVWYDVEKAKDAALKKGAEGIIVKDNLAPYEFGKRSTYWQKQKYDSETIDVVITDFHEGSGEGSGTLGAVSIESADGVPLGRSGSGFSDSERDRIWNNQDEWLGRTVEIEARGLSSDHNNLRMPIWTGRDRTDDGKADSFERVKEIMKGV